MRLLAITALALTVLLTACADPQGGDVSGDDLSTSETQFYTFQQTLPLPVSTTPGDTLYRNPMIGIDVVDVLADGRPVAAKPSMVLFVGIDTSAVTVESGTYIYDISLDPMLFWKRPGSSDLNLIEFSIPEDVMLLEIRYRLVPYDSEPEPRIYTMTARRIG